MKPTKQLDCPTTTLATYPERFVRSLVNGRRWCGALLLLSIAALSSSAVIAEPVYTVRDLGSLGGSYGIPVSVNNKGQVVGDAWTAGDATLRATLFSTSGDSSIDLGTLGGNHSYTKSINNNGQVVGYSQTTANTWRATLFSTSGGTNISLGTLGGRDSVATSISDSGQVVGYADLSNNFSHATLFNTTGGPNVDLSPFDPGVTAALAISNSSQVVGYSNGMRATLFSTTGGANVDLGTLGGYASSALAISDTGHIVGWANVAGDSFQHATLFSTSGGTNIDLGTLGGTSSWATAINYWGQVVGYDVGGNDAFIWSSGVMTSIDSLIESATEWDLVYALDINDQGQIATYGYSRNTGALHGLLLSPRVDNQVPEPTSLLLVAIALLGAAFTRMRKLRCPTMAPPYCNSGHRPITRAL